MLGQSVGVGVDPPKEHGPSNPDRKTPRPHQHTVGNQVSLLLRWAPSTALQDLASVAPVEIWVAVAKHTGWPWGAPNCRARWLKLLIALMSRGKHADPRRLWNSGGCILGFSESEAHRN